MAKREKKGSASAATAEIEVAKNGDPRSVVAPMSAALGADDEEAKFCERSGAIPPVHPPEFVARLCESSTALAPVIQAIATNVDGHDYQLKSVFGPALTDEDIETAIIYTRESRGDMRPVTKLDIEQQRLRVERAQRLEKLRIQGMLSACCPGPTNSLTVMRMKRRRDLLGLGDCYTEFVRCLDGTMGELNHLRAASMRLRHVIPEPVEVPVIRRLSPLVVERTTRRARFRTFVQFGPTGRDVYFKEYGDPRPISMHDGKVYETYEELRALGHRAATEIIWASTPGLSARTAYGIPTWIASDAVLIGLRQAQVVNADHFSEKAIPQLVVLVNGAAATAKMVTTIREHFRQIQGAHNYHRVLVLGASPPLGGTHPVSIDIRPLRQAIPDDALFQKYEMNAAQTIRSQYRIAKLLLGLGEDVNRATADAVLRFSEEQVFGPMRKEFDELMNDILMDEGYRYWTFASNSPVAGNPLDASKLMSDAATAGAVSINQLLEMQSAIDNRVYEKIDEAWADMPLSLFKGLVTLKKDPTEAMQKPGAVSSPTPENDVEPTSPDEIKSLFDRVRNHPRAEEGIEVDTAKGRTLVMLLPPKKFGQLLAAAAA
jgi:capsid portal protein